jgi:Arc/MetJ family transcription regulator
MTSAYSGEVGNRMGVLMREGSIVDIDEDAFANAAALLGTSGWSDTINAALREIGRIRQRQEAFGLLAEMGARGDFDDFLDKRSYRR